MTPFSTKSRELARLLRDAVADGRTTVKELRIASGAESDSTVYDWLSGKRPPSLEHWYYLKHNLRNGDIKNQTRHAFDDDSDTPSVGNPVEVMRKAIVNANCETAEATRALTDYATDNHISEAELTDLTVRSMRLGEAKSKFDDAVMSVRRMHGPRLAVGA